MARTDASPIKFESTSQAQGRQWWRSLEELSETAEFHDYLHREFPENATEWLAGSRRDFLRLMGASLFLAGVAGCNIKQPQEKIVPSVRSAGHASPGMPLYFTTAYDFAGSAIGLTVESRDGRPIKIEGNSNHPGSLGATHIFAQAATLDLYDPDRGRTPKHRGQIATRDQLEHDLIVRRRTLDETKGRGLRILIGSSTSPTLERLLHRVSTRWPQSKWSVFELVNDDFVRAGMTLAYGEQADGLCPIYDFRQARIVVSVDCDFLGARDMPPCYIRQFADSRRIADRRGSDREGQKNVDARTMVRLYHLGSTPTPTSAKADHQLAVPPSLIEKVLAEVFTRLRGHSDVHKSPQQGGPHEAWIAKLVDDLRLANRNALVVAGRGQSPIVHAIAHAINEHVGATGTTVRFVQSSQVRPIGSPSDIAMLQELTTEMHAGQVEMLLMLGDNPVFKAPSDIDFAKGLSKVRFTLAMANAEDETTAASGWFVPLSHFLESWGDARAFDGTASIVQPLIAPLHESFSTIELLSIFCEDEPSGYDAVRRTWNSKLGEKEDDPRWRQAVASGVVENSAAQIVEVSFQRDAEILRPSKATSKQPIRSETDERFEISIQPDPTIWDGRFINNGWLQELPKPLTHTVWDNAAWIAPADAKRMQLTNGDVVSIGESNSHSQAVEVPVWIVPGHAIGCLTVFTGYGRRVVGRVGKGTGFDIQSLIVANATTQRTSLLVRKTKRKHQIVTTQHHQMMEGRHIARAGSLTEFLAQPDHPTFAHPPNPASNDSFYPEWPYEGHKWGMTIDLTTCVGCSACVIACQAENNIPVVGKDQVALNRQMHWMRVDTYYSGSPDQPDQTLNQPVTCMHCERAPCEVVCPVAATNHSDEGINQMIYNRCVGTRYCSNNCPYKVRRFNFLDFSDAFISDSSLHLLSNPEVTMRQRGVMEKCTYCIQRIEKVRIASQLEDRKIQDGEIKTACQSVCPAQAIRFGDLNDPKSNVRATHDHPLNYQLLEELNTKPRTTYLAEVTNPKEATG